MAITPSPVISRRKSKKLEITRTTLRDLTVRKDVKGGMIPVSKWTQCGQGGPTQCVPIVY